MVFFTSLTRAENAPRPWPSIFKASGKTTIKLIKKGNGTQPYIYRTKHFELRSPTPLNEFNTRLFASAAESVPAVLTALPLPLLGMPKKGTAKILIYPDEESYIKEGGSLHSAGVYLGKKSSILLRADTFLRPKQPSESKLPPKADYSLLVHEFTHLCMHRDLASLPPWFSEGTADYLAAAYVNHGVYDFSYITSAIRKRIRHQLPNDKDTITLPSIIDTMALNSTTWKKRLTDSDAHDGYRAYATSLLIVHSLFHGGKKRRDATRNYLEKVQKQPRVRVKDQSLIPVKECQILQQRIIDFWRPRGLRIKFEKSKN